MQAKLAEMEAELRERREAAEASVPTSKTTSPAYPSRKVTEVRNLECTKTAIWPSCERYTLLPLYSSKKSLFVETAENRAFKVAPRSLKPKCTIWTVRTVRWKSTDYCLHAFARNRLYNGAGRRCRKSRLLSRLFLADFCFFAGVSKLAAQPAPRLAPHRRS